MKWTAIVLAAGASQRMGQPKALLPIGEHTFLTRLIATFREAGANEVLVVVGAHANAVRDSKPPCVVVDNLGWNAGQLSSAQAGIRHALLAKPDALLIHPVDAPRIQPSTVRQLTAHARTALASFHGTPGHPILLKADEAAALLNTKATTLADAIAPLHPESVEVSDSSVLENFNDPKTWATAQVDG